MTARDAAFWALFLLLLPQAIWVRKTAPRFPAAKGPTTGETSRRANRLRLLAVGDSIIAGVGARTLEHALIGQAATHLADNLDAGVSWTAFGTSGATTQRIMRRLLPEAKGDPVDAVIVSSGVNDIISLHGTGRWRDDVEALVTAISDRWPEAVIAFSGLPPMNHFPALPRPLRALFGMRARQFDRTLREILERHDQAVHIPLDFEASPGSFSADGFHPSEQSYAEFGKMTAAAIAQRLQTHGIADA